MKRILITIAPAIFILFTACSGKKNAPAPAAACASDESLKNLTCVSQMAQQVCCDEQTANTQTYAAYCQAVVGNASTAGGYALPEPPAPPAPQPVMPAAIPGCSAPTKAMTCQQAMTNFELQYKTTYATCKNGESEAWKKDQGAAVVSCVGSNMGINSVEDFAKSPQAQCMAQNAYQNFASQIPASISSEIPGGAISTITNNIPASLSGATSTISNSLSGVAVETVSGGTTAIENMAGLPASNTTVANSQIVNLDIPLEGE